MTGYEILINIQKGLKTKQITIIKKRRSNQIEEIKKIHAIPLIIEGLIWNENNNSRLCGIEKNPKKEILLTKLELGM